MRASFFALSVPLAALCLAGAPSAAESHPAREGAATRVPAGDVQKPKHRRRIVKLHGTKRVRRLTLARGRTYVVTKSLRIISRGRVTINGPVQIARGASLRIKAGGRILNRARISARPTGHGSRAGGSCATPSDILEIARFGITVAQPITAPSGGTAPDGSGCPGGSVTIEVRVGSATIDKPVSAGDGGPGKVAMLTPAAGATECRTLSHDSSVNVKSGPGGRGGDVLLSTHNVIAGGKVDARGADLRAGSGGHGGDIDVTAPDGGPGHAGEGIDATSGRGGPGGDVTFERRFTHRRDVTTHIGTGGVGGRPGNVRAHAGNGGADNCAGGSTRIRIGSRGDNGLGGHEVVDKPSAVVDVSGGNADPGPAGPADPVGGQGGALVVTRTDNKFDADVSRVTVSSSGNGGAGYDGCLASPHVAGGGGGPAGPVLASHLFVTDSFNGGHGGDGSPPGEGGLRSTPEAVSAIDSFIHGAAGNACTGGNGSSGTETFETLALPSATDSKANDGKRGTGSLITGSSNGVSGPFLGHFDNDGALLGQTEWPSVGLSPNGTQVLPATGGSVYVLGSAVPAGGARTFAAKAASDLTVDSSFDADGVGVYSGPGNTPLSPGTGYLSGGALQVVGISSGAPVVALIDPASGAALGHATLSLSQPLPNLQQIWCVPPDGAGRVACAGRTTQGSGPNTTFGMGVFTFAAPSAPGALNATSRDFPGLSQPGGIGRMPGGTLVVDFTGNDSVLRIQGLDPATLADDPGFHGGGAISVAGGQGVFGEQHGLISWGNGMAVTMSQFTSDLAHYQPAVALLNASGNLVTSYGDAASPGVRVLPYTQVRLVAGDPVDSQAIEFYGADFSTQNQAHPVAVRISGVPSP